MMYHVSSTLGDGQLISPETKYNLLFKNEMVDLLISNRENFCERYSDEAFQIRCENETGWPHYSKIFCECIFEYCRREINDGLFPRMESIYLSPSLQDAMNFKKNYRYDNEAANIFSVNIDMNQCQSYDMNLFTEADTYLKSKEILDNKIFEECCKYAYKYWKKESSENPQKEFLYWGEVVVTLLKDRNQVSKTPVNGGSE